MVFVVGSDESRSAWKVGEGVVFCRPLFRFIFLRISIKIRMWILGGGCAVFELSCTARQGLMKIVRSNLLKSFCYCYFSICCFVFFGYRRFPIGCMDG